MTVLRDVLRFLHQVEDFGRLSGSQMRTKHGADPAEGYDWLAKRALVLAKNIEAEISRDTGATSE